MPYSLTELCRIRDAAKAMINSTPCTEDFFASAELALVKAIKACPDLMLHFGDGRSPFPKTHGTRIIQFHDETFVWYDEAGLQGGCTYSLEQAELELARYAKSLNEEPSARFYGLPGYERLVSVLKMAHDQAAGGKGKERHANDKPFHEQRMLSISHELGSPYGMAYQACKKISEGLQLGNFERTVAELLGAINYTAGIVVYLQDKQPTFMNLKPSTAENWGQGSCASGQVNADGDVEFKSEPEQHHPV
jgi:hypothetical protein